MTSDNNDVEIKDGDFEIEYDPFLKEDSQKFCIVIGYSYEKGYPLKELAESIKQQILSDQKLRKNLEMKIKELEWKIDKQNGLRYDEVATRNMHILYEFRELKEGKLKC